MKIYTKKGDSGQTDLMFKRVSKADLHISVNGAIDEAMAFILMSKHEIKDALIKADLDQIHDHLFQICFEIALNDPKKYKTTEKDTNWIEERIDFYDKKLQPLTKFIKLDQTLAASWLNLARVTIRRAERELVLLSQSDEINPYTLSYVNRLSDYLFTLARVFDEL
ncbi:MAG: ATP:cob(I)alamin adenosyltransferase [Tenericutes bacterium HGW-Tenericutes-6]|nr:MAG: ATP:cob(I)alamin adenosyltransferase [Tenericutes bacterium HGW-Tenericutes-6]PKK97564.1 MAG: ATP:cob(I)alamin adenosyltransferase [Tenericutes bacterium HGW-Tenericutes-3]